MRIKEFAYADLVGTIEQKVGLVYKSLKRIAARLRFGINHNNNTRSTRAETWIGL